MVGWLARRQRRAKVQNLNSALEAVAASSVNFGEKLASVLVAGRQPGRIFTAVEIEIATDLGLRDIRERVRSDFMINDMPQEAQELVLTACMKACREKIRTGIYRALPPDALEMEGIS